jgi:NMD protein affecting ribosome stability and mRNA decay
VLSHPCKIQLRGFGDRELEIAKKIASRFSSELQEGKNGPDIYFSDVNEARKFISRLKKVAKFNVKMSTSYAGLRKGRVRVLFVYSLRALSSESKFTKKR